MLNGQKHYHSHHRFEQKSHELKRNHEQPKGIFVSPQSGKFIQTNHGVKNGFQVEEMKQKLNHLLKKTEFVLNRQKSIQSPTLKNCQTEKQIFFTSPQSERPFSTDSFSPKKQKCSSIQKEKEEKEADFSTKHISKQESESEFNPQSIKSQQGNRQIKGQRSFEVQKNGYDGKEKKLIESWRVGKVKESEVKKRSKLENEDRPEQQLTWTKYIALELKNKELLKFIEELDKKFEEKLQVERKQIDKKEQVIKHVSRKLYDCIKSYEEKIAKLINDHEEEIKQKNSHIKRLVEELSTSTLEQKNQIFMDKINKIMEENLNFKNQLTEMQKEKHQLQIMLKIKEESIKEISSSKLILQSQIESMKFTIQNGSTITSSFEENLKIQLKTNDEMKKQIEILQDQINRLSEEVKSLRSDEDKAFKDVKMKEIKESTLRNRLLTEMGIKLQEKDNKIGSLEKKMSTLEEKYKSAYRQIREKDDFLKSHLMGRTDENQVKEEVQKVIGSYKQAFMADETGRIQQLEDEVSKLKKKVSYYEKNW